MWGFTCPLTIETVLDPAIQPFLHDHQIDGTPVLPGVMGIEAFAEAALCLLPGWHVETIEDVEFLGAVQVLPERASRADGRNNDSSARRRHWSPIADCLASRRLPNQAEPQRDYALYGAACD